MGVVRTSLVDVASLSLIAVGACPLFSPVSVSIHFYSCGLCTHFTAKYSGSVFYANICTKKVHLMAKMLFYAAYGVWVVHVASDLNSGIYFGTNKCRS